jgi:hypothetical protein
MREQGRLLWYNLNTAKLTKGGSPIIAARYFSATAALNLLATAGVKRVRSLGVDGGSSYSGQFADLKRRTLLPTGRKSYDRQFEEIAMTIATTGIDFGAHLVSAVHYTAPQ